MSKAAPPARRSGARRAPGATSPWSARLSEVLNLKRQAARPRPRSWAARPYEALMDQYEPGARDGRHRPRVRRLRRFPARTSCRACWSARRRRRQPIEPKGPFPRRRRRRSAERLMQAPRLRLQARPAGRQPHPFCGGVPDDVRITTRYGEDDFAQALMGVMHETGHALYERSLPAEWRLQPVGQAARHERAREPVAADGDAGLRAARSSAASLAPLLRETFPGNGAGAVRRRTCSGSTAACSPASSGSMPTR